MTEFMFRWETWTEKYDRNYGHLILFDALLITLKQFLHKSILLFLFVAF